MSRNRRPSSQMPAEPWMYACGFRVVIGKLLELTLPKGDPLRDPFPDGDMGKCKLLICAGTPITFDVDFHTAIIGLQPSVTEAPVQDPVQDPAAIVQPRLHYHVGELVQVNLSARFKVALSIERYFSNVSHQTNTQGD